MAERQRSPFGELVYSYRIAANLTQAALAERINTPRPGFQHATLSSRAISTIERHYAPGEPWLIPRTSTVHSLATGLGLSAGTPAWREFVRASHARRGSYPPEPQPRPPVRVAGTRTSEATGPGFIAAGRETHLDQLRRAIARASSGIPGMMFVGAGPGAGKTSLIAQACREAALTDPNLVVLWGESTGRSGAADPHQPVRQALGTMAGNVTAVGPRQIISPDNARRIVERLPIAIDALASEGAELIDRIIPSRILRSLLDANQLDEPVRQQLTALLATPAASIDNGVNGLVLRVLQHYARAGPVVLVLEDLHWADASTISFLFHLGRRLPDQQRQILVIGSSRPGDPDREHLMAGESFPPTLSELRRLFPGSTIDLSTAVGGDGGQAFVDAMVTRTIEDPPPDLRRTLFEQTGGLPLLVQGMLELHQSTGHTQVLRTGTDLIDLPAGIEALFASLLGQLPRDLRQHLAVASVQGVTFSADVTMQVLGMTRAALVDVLDSRLNRRFQLIEPGGVTSVAGQRSYVYQFSHALVRDYIYFTMTDLERESNHIATAEAMLALYGDGEHDAAGDIARHFDLAGDRRRAAAAYNRAGLQAMRLRDFELAKARFTRVGELDLEDDDPFLAAQALLGLGNCARGESDAVLAARCFARALGLARRKSLRIIEAAALSCIGLVDYTAGRVSQAATVLTEAVEILVAEGDRAEQSRTLTFLSHALHGMGRYDDAIATARDAIAIGTNLADDLLVAPAMIALAICWTDLGHYEAAATLYRESIAISERLGHTHRATLAWYNLAAEEIEREQWDKAEAANRHVLDPARRPTLGLLGNGEFNAGFIAAGRGRYGDAARHFERSLDFRTRNGQAALAMESRGGLLRIAVAKRDRGAIQEQLTLLRNWIGAHGVEGMEHPGRLFVALSEAHLELGDRDRARETARDGLALVTDRADALADPEHRASYLNGVRAHRRLRELAAH